MARNRVSRKYVNNHTIPPELAAPIIAQNPPASAKDIQEIKQHSVNEALRMAGESVRKIDQYLKHYEIADDENRWFNLAFAFAREFVPGFGVERQKVHKRSPKWDTFIQIRLWHEVNVLIKKEAAVKISVSSVCENLSKRDFWKQRKVSSKTLRNIYSNFIGSELFQTIKFIENNCIPTELESVLELVIKQTEPKVSQAN